MTRSTTLSLIVLAVTTCAHSAQAALVLEHDFRNFGGGTFVASAGVAGVTPTAPIFDDTIANSAGTALGPGNTKVIPNPKVATGFFTNQDRDADRVQTDATYGQMFNDAANNNFGSGTIALVMKPQFSATNARHWFAQHGNFAGNNNSLSFLGGGPLTISGGRSGDSNNFALTTGGTFPWNPNAWYLIAASWQQSSGPDVGNNPSGNGDIGLPDGKLRLYARTLKVGNEFTPDSLATFVSDDAVAVWNNRLNTMNGTLNLGQRNTNQATEAALADFALYQFYDTTFDQGDFDALFDSLIAIVPEPSTAPMLLAGLLFLRRRRRPRNKGTK